MSFKITKKQRQILAQQGRSLGAITADDVRHYRKMAVTSSAAEIAAHNAAIAAKKAAKKSTPPEMAQPKEKP